MDLILIILSVVAGFYILSSTLDYFKNGDTCREDQRQEEKRIEAWSKQYNKDNARK